MLREGEEGEFYYPAVVLFQPKQTYKGGSEWERGGVEGTQLSLPTPGTCSAGDQLGDPVTGLHGQVVLVLGPQGRKAAFSPQFKGTSQHS